MTSRPRRSVSVFVPSPTSAAPKAARLVDLLLDLDRAGIMGAVSALRQAQGQAAVGRPARLPGLAPGQRREPGRRIAGCREGGDWQIRPGRWQRKISRQGA